MGIKSIEAFLKEKCPSAYMNVPLTVFTDKCIAIDAPILIYKYITIANNTVINEMNNPLDVINKRRILSLAVEKILDFNMVLFSHRITPIWIFDGKPIDAKATCLVKRKETKDKIIDKINNARQELESKHVLKITQDELNNFKKVLRTNPNVTQNDIREIYTILKKIGIPSFIAEGDAEKLCSALDRERIVHGVWSSDSDNYALGTSIRIFEFANRIQGQYYVSIVRLETILEECKISLFFLVDFCIMCGCDFNSNIPLIGPKKSYKLLEQCKSIDNLPEFNGKTFLDKTILNHQNCRLYFAYTGSNISKTNVVIDWDDYLINIDSVINDYEIINKSKFQAFTGF